MPLSIAYYVVLLVWIVFLAWQGGLNAVGANIIQLLLFVIIGIQVFGNPIQRK